MKAFVLGAAAVAAAFVSVPAGAVGFINTLGGDGTFTPGPGSFFGTIKGNNDGIANNIAQYTEIAGADAMLEFVWAYRTADVDGSGFDPAGYVLNGVYTQLTVSLARPAKQGGTFSINLAAGDEFGFYVSSTDGSLGRGILAFGPAGIPEAGTWAMMIAGFGLVGFAARRRREALAA